MTAGSAPGSPTTPAQAGEPLPVALSDTFLELMGTTSIGVLRRIWDDLPPINRDVELERRLLASVTEGLLEAPTAIDDLASLGIPAAASECRLDNLFFRNVHARALAASIARAYRKSGGGATRRDIDLGGLVVPLYLSFMSAVSESVPSALRELLTATGSESVAGGDATADSRKKAFDGVVQALEAALDRAWGGDLQGGLKALLDAIMIVREAREEEAALTVDIRLPLNCSWDLVYEAANTPDGGVLTKSDLPHKQDLLKALSAYPRQEIVHELEDLSRHLGRGVSLSSLRERAPTPGSGKSLFQCQAIWPSHGGAPLSQLYDLSWEMPSELAEPDVRLIMYAGSTILLAVQGDPFLEYRHGCWRYVDLWGKTKVISRVVEPNEDKAEVLDPTLYRVGRLAYQLAYHHHGATIDLNLGKASTSTEKLDQLRNRWDVDGVSTDGLPLLRATKEGGTGETEPTHMGRFAYALCIQDGMSVWDMPSGPAELYVREFGQIMTVQGDEVRKEWRQMASRDGFPETRLGGGRHHAAFQRCLEPNTRRIVFCVSQDGKVDVFSEKHWMPLR